MRRHLLISILLLMGGWLLSASSIQIPYAPSVPQVIGIIEYGQGQWIILKADVKIDFVTAENEKASCDGDLLYDRWRERVFLKCFNDKKELLFIYKTHDRRFELYFPQKKILFHGDIFDLEFAEDIESHIKPLQFYRALKIGAIPPKQTVLEKWNKEFLALQVYGYEDNDSYLARKVVAARDGRVVQEIFYDRDGRANMNVYRAEFKKIRSRDSALQKSFLFPHEIIIEVPPPTSASQKTQTIFHFQDVTFLPYLEDGEFIIKTTPDTETSMI